MGLNISLYDILSQLIPGFVVYVSILRAMHLEWDKDYVLPATIFSFLIGYFINTLSSWLESFYFYTWGGKPSTRLLKGKGLKSVTFYQSAEAVNLLKSETANANPSEDELFQIAIRYATGAKDTRVEIFNNNYAFSRGILTTCIIAWLMLFADLDSNRFIIVFGIPIILVAWQRSKERGYYFAKEVLQVYFRLKHPI